MSDSDEPSKGADGPGTSFGEGLISGKQKKHHHHHHKEKKKHKKHKSKEKSPEAEAERPGSADVLRDALLDFVIKSQKKKEKGKEKESVPDPPLDLPPPLKKLEKRFSPPPRKKHRSRSAERQKERHSSHKDHSSRRGQELSKPSTSSDGHRERPSFSPRRRDIGDDYRRRERGGYGRRDDFGRDRGRERDGHRKCDQPSYLTSQVKANADQVRKRKLLWQKGKEKPDPSCDVKSAVWQTMIGASVPGTGVEKFKKLMGIKSDQLTTDEKLSEEQLKKQEELLTNLDKQYAVARSATHTHRGVGLGFATQLDDWQHKLHNAINAQQHKNTAVQHNSDNQQFWKDD